MKTQLLQAMGSFALGGSVALVGLLSWTGTTDLQTIKTSVQNHMTDTEQQVSLFMQEDYKVQVDNANKEIGDYQVALDKANSNIDKLITAYENAEEEHRKEILSLEMTHDGELADLQTELEVMQRRLDHQYETDMNEVIEQANGEIQKANQEVADTKEQVLSDLQTSQIDEYIKNAKEYDKVNTGNDKSVHDISSIVPSEQE